MSTIGRMNRPTSITLPSTGFASARAPHPPPSIATSAPIDIISNDSSSGGSEDEDEPPFVGTPFKTDPSNPYEYPFPPMSPMSPATSRSPTLSTASANLSNVSLSSTASSSSVSLASLVIGPIGASPRLNSSSRISPPPRFHSRIPSALAASLKLDSQGPIPPSLIGRDLGKLSPALGLEPGEILTAEKLHLGNRSRGKSLSNESAFALSPSAPSIGGGPMKFPSMKRGM